jgi:hypothetical protein
MRPDIFLSEGTLTNETTLEFRLPPFPSVRILADIPFQITGTATYAFVVPNACRLTSQSASGSFTFTLDAVRQGLPEVDFLTPGQEPDLPKTAARCRNRDGVEFDTEFPSVAGSALWA